MFPLEQGDVHEGPFPHPLPVEQQEDVHVGGDVGGAAQAHGNHVEGVFGNGGDEFGGPVLVVPVLVVDVDGAGQLDAALDPTADDESIELGKGHQLGVEANFRLVHTIDDVVADVEAVKDVDKVVAVEELADAVGIETESQRGLQADLAADAYVQRGVDRVGHPEADLHIQRCRLEEHQVGRLAGEQVDHRVKRVVDDREGQRVAGLPELGLEVIERIHRANGLLAGHVDVRQADVEAGQGRQAGQAEGPVEVGQQVGKAEARQPYVGHVDDHGSCRVDQSRQQAAVGNQAAPAQVGAGGLLPDEFLAEAHPMHGGPHDLHGRQEGADATEIHVERRCGEIDGLDVGGADEGGNGIRPADVHFATGRPGPGFPGSANPDAPGHLGQQELELGQEFGGQVDIGHHHRHVETRGEVAGQDVGQAQVGPAGLDVEFELGDVAAPVENAGDREVHRGHVDVRCRHLDVGVQRKIEGQGRRFALEDVKQRGVLLPADAGLQAEFERAVLDVHIGQIEVGQIHRHVDVGQAGNGGQRRQVELAVLGAGDNQRLGNRNQHARGAGRQAVDDIEQAHHGDGEVHLGYAAKQGRHVGGQLEHRVVAAHQLGQAGNRGGQRVDDRHDRVGDILDDRHDGIEEAREEGAGVEINVGEPDARVADLEELVVARGEELVDLLDVLVLVVGHPRHVEVAEDGRQVALAAQRNTQFHVQVDLRPGVPLHLDQVGQLGVAEVGEGKAASGEDRQGRNAEQADVFQIDAKVQLQAGARAVGAAVAIKQAGGAPVGGAQGAAQAVHRIGARAPDARVVVLDPAVPVVGHGAVQEEQLGIELGGVAAGARGQEHVHRGLQFLDGRRLAGLADQPQIVDVGVVDVALDPRRDALESRVGAVGGDFADAGVARHVGHNVKALGEVDAEAEVEIPVQVEGDAAVERQVEARHTDVEAQVEARCVGLAEVHAELDGRALANGHLGRYFGRLGLDGLLEFGEDGLGDVGGAVDLVGLEHRRVGGQGAGGRAEGVGNVGQGRGGDASPENVLQQVLVAVAAGCLAGHEADHFAQAAEEGRFFGDPAEKGEQILGSGLDAVDGVRHVIDDGLQAAIEDHLARFTDVARRAVVVEDRGAAGIRGRHVDAGRDPGGALAAQHRRDRIARTDAQVVGETRVDVRLDETRDVLDDDIVRGDQVVAVVVAQEVEEDIAAQLTGFDDVVAVGIRGERVEQEHAQRVVEAAVLVHRRRQRGLDGVHHVAAQVGDELGCFLQLVADDRQVEHVTEGIEALLDTLEHRVDGIDDDRRVTQQKDQRTIDRIARVAAFADGALEHLAQLLLPVFEVRQHQADVVARGRRIGLRAAAEQARRADGDTGNRGAGPCPFGRCEVGIGIDGGKRTFVVVVHRRAFGRGGADAIAGGGSCRQHGLGDLAGDDRVAVGGLGAIQQGEAALAAHGGKDVAEVAVIQLHGAQRQRVDEAVDLLDGQLAELVGHHQGHRQVGHRRAVEDDLEVALLEGRRVGAAFLAVGAQVEPPVGRTVAGVGGQHEAAA